MHNLWGKLLIQQCTACPQLIHFGSRFNDCRRTVFICSLHGGNSFRKRPPGIPAVRGSPNNRAKIDMAGSGQHFNPISSTSWRTPSIHNFMKNFKYLQHNCISIIIVIAILWRLIQKKLAYFFLSGKIYFQRC